MVRDRRKAFKILPNSPEFIKVNRGALARGVKLLEGEPQCVGTARNALLDELLTGEQQSKLKELKAAKKGKKEK